MALLILVFLFISTPQTQANSPFIYSPFGEEKVVQFSAIYLTQFKTLQEMASILPADRSNYISYSIIPTLKYLFGPLTHRGLGGIRKLLSLKVSWENAYQTDRGVIVPFEYQGLWLVDTHSFTQPEFILPLPFNNGSVFSNQWQSCSDPEHSSASHYWYYWDPKRPRCDQKKEQHYQDILISFTNPSPQTQRTFPEYERMIRSENGKKKFPMTFAFGYFETPPRPNPDTDKDIGALEYQRFQKELKKLIPSSAKESLLYSNLYPGTENRKIYIGKRYQFIRAGTQFDIKIVMSAGVDQMLLFAKSFAADHDSYFGWLGHSRVGSGFDAENFSYLLRTHQQWLSITSQYQMVYWGGCNSYSYYTDPFFAMKSTVSPNDPMGTKGLDIVANGLPSYFGLNAENALIHLKALLDWQKPTSYQDILQEMEKTNIYRGHHFLAVVLGDEDNPTLK
ncbi:MAG: hypothetical protein RJB66_1621 [Pseudomonadota bacterium]|jgi:hypothetical protein